ncbi:E3 ubiquitin-protein ligase NRDP1-like [Adelges cooleyi]|uniref:E3 ubiquitin-protein ligase NRDP1-like n=1 Tax=Adelges cooleyi TaxID=133065 RepID=UPI00218004CF|nr:E3 ubiquitin-protein ligase NRDP1-like [Adelges cooleyi]
MIWKIVFLLTCFNVLVDAGGCCEPGGTLTDEVSDVDNNTEVPQPYETIAQWLEVLKEQGYIDWTKLAKTPRNNQIENARAGLAYSRCPSTILGDLLKSSKQINWPPELASAITRFERSVLRTYTYRRIPKTQAVFLAPSENQGVPESGLLLIFDKLEGTEDDN